MADSKYGKFSSREPGDNNNTSDDGNIEEELTKNSLDKPMVEFDVPEDRKFAIKFTSGEHKNPIRVASDRQLENGDAVRKIVGKKSEDTFVLGHVDANKGLHGKQREDSFEPMGENTSQRVIKETSVPETQQTLGHDLFSSPEPESSEASASEGPNTEERSALQSSPWKTRPEEKQSELGGSREDTEGDEAASTVDPDGSPPKIPTDWDADETPSPSKREIESRILRNGFMVSLIIGGLIIAFFDSMFLTQPGEGSQIKWLTTTLAAGVMIFYLLWAKFKKHYKHPTARELFADSFYYLGFLFTFIALASGIIQMEGENMNVQRIVGQLGVALITTILGMAVRVYMVQFSPIISEPEQDLMDTLGSLANEMSTLANNFNTHLHGSINQLIDFRSQLLGELEVTKRTLTDNLQNTFDEVHSKSFERVTGSLNNFQGAVENVGEVIGQFSSEINKLDFRSVGAAAPQLGEKMAILTNDLTSIQSNLEPILRSLSTSSNDLETLADSAREIKETQKEFEQISASTQQLNSTLERANETARASDDAVKKQLRRLDGTLDQAIQSAEGVDTEMGKLNKTFQQNALEILRFLRKETRD